MSLSQIVSLIYGRLEQLLSTAPKGALSVTGILGLALLVYGYFQLRGNDNRGGERRPARHPHQAPAASGQQQPASAAARASTPTSSAPATSAAPAPSPAAGAHANPVSRAITSQLSGVKRVTLSLPGVLLLEAAPSQLQESATVRPDALEVLHEVARITDVYLIAHVEDDLGEAVVTGALEACGLLGSAPGQVKPHHVLCCSTLDGKVPIVRQLEPELHVDAHPASVDELKRFLPRLLLVRDGAAASGSASAASPNVVTAASLPAYFGL